jgi:hypothetical protein
MGIKDSLRGPLFAFRVQSIDQLCNSFHFRRAKYPDLSPTLMTQTLSFSKGIS